MGSRNSPWVASQSFHGRWSVDTISAAYTLQSTSFS